MRQWLRLVATVAAAVAAPLGSAGCATVSQAIAPRPVCDNPLVVPSDDLEAVWKQTVVALDEYFEIRSENRLARTIVTDPVISATLLEPWRGDSPTLYARFEASLQTIRRLARVQIEPVPGRGYSVKVEVLKELEDLSRPDRSAPGRAVFNNDFPVNRTREIVGPVPAANQWIPRGRDTELEQVILNRIRDGLFL